MKNVQKFAAALAAGMMLITATTFAENDDTSSSSSSSSTTSSSTSSSSSPSSSSSTSSARARSYGKQARLLEKKTSRGVKSGTVDASCVQNAVTTRETALIAALTVRKDALVAAWGMTGVSPARNESIKTAWSTYRNARKNAWKTFKGTMRETCKISELGSDSGTGDGE